MYAGPCCPGKNAVRKIVVGGHLIGIAFLDGIIEKALASGSGDEDELRSLLLRELRVYNYLPPSAEDEYLEAVWNEFLKERARRHV